MKLIISKNQKNAFYREFVVIEFINIYNNSSIIKA